MRTGTNCSIHWFTLMLLLLLIKLSLLLKESLVLLGRIAAVADKLSAMNECIGCFSKKGLPFFSKTEPLIYHYR